VATLRERQAPLKQQYQDDPESGKIVMAVRSVTAGNDPTRCTIATTDASGKVLASWDAAAHPMAGGDGELACSGDLLLASLAACQEITVRMVASAMGVELQELEQCSQRHSKRQNSKVMACSYLPSIRLSPFEV
jgi:hypothetical protein